MGLQSMQNQDMGLVLSTDVKPRLKWTPELHQRFIEAIIQLGGADKATPKTLMRVMGIPGLTLYHLKSHLQKFRLGKNQQSESGSDNKQEGPEYSDNGKDIDGTHTEINESLQIAQALQMQMEVQKKLHEQIEVQRRLQLRIEAQGKYLQSVLNKAQETLAGYNSSSLGIEVAKAEFSQLLSMVDNRCPSSSFSGLTETGDLSLKVGERTMRITDCSMDSSLTSSESSGRKYQKLTKTENGGDTQTAVVLQLMENVSDRDQPWKTTGSSDQVGRRKRNGSSISDEPSTKRSAIDKEWKKIGLSEKFDLNSQYHHIEVNSGTGRQELDLNCWGSEAFNE